MLTIHQNKLTLNNNTLQDNAALTPIYISFVNECSSLPLHFPSFRPIINHVYHNLHSRRGRTRDESQSSDPLHPSIASTLTSLQIIKTPHFEYRFYTNGEYSCNTTFHNSNEQRRYGYDQQYLKQMGSWLQTAVVRRDYKENA